MYRRFELLTVSSLLRPARTAAADGLMVETPRPSLWPVSSAGMLDGKEFVSAFAVAFIDVFVFGFDETDLRCGIGGRFSLFLFMFEADPSEEEDRLMKKLLRLL